MKKRMVTTWYLEMLDESDYRPTNADAPTLEIKRVKIPSPDLNKSLYQRVGADYEWIDRLSWTERQWFDYAHSGKITTFVAYYG
ncbi:MAG: GNAT family N-acetyltransferase, partial [Desulfobacterales bacterium]|nr:GNAT family N-acetyltransferase [Desulfobacterales bacterium]